MKTKLVLLSLALVSMLSFARITGQEANTISKVKSIENVSSEREPMRPFEMVDQNQFD